MYKKFLALTFVLALAGSCKEEADPCDDLKCLNGGECHDGQCDCPEGYTSFNCGDQITPSRIMVSKVKVTSWPEQRVNDDPWDSDSDPDILWELRTEQNQTVLSSDSVYYDAATGVDLEQNIQPQLSITSPAAQGYFFRIQDLDAGNFKETMDQAGFRFYEPFNGFPDILNVQTERGLSVQFTLSYEWD